MCKGGVFGIKLTVAFADGFFVARTAISNTGEHTESPVFVDFLGAGQNAKLL